MEIKEIINSIFHYNIEQSSDVPEVEKFFNMLGAKVKEEEIILQIEKCLDELKRLVEYNTSNHTESFIGSFELLKYYLDLEGFLLKFKYLDKPIVAAEKSSFDSFWNVYQGAKHNKEDKH